MYQEHKSASRTFECTINFNEKLALKIIIKKLTESHHGRSWSSVCKSFKILRWPLLSCIFRFSWKGLWDMNLPISKLRKMLKKTVRNLKKKSPLRKCSLLGGDRKLKGENVLITTMWLNEGEMLCIGSLLLDPVCQVRSQTVKFLAFKRSFQATIMKKTKKHLHITPMKRNQVKKKSTEPQRSQREEEIDTEIPIIDLQRNRSQVLFISMLQEPNSYDRNVLKVLLVTWLRYCHLNGSYWLIRTNNLLSRRQIILYKLTMPKSNLKDRLRNKKDRSRPRRDKKKVRKRHKLNKMRSKERIQQLIFTTQSLFNKKSQKKSQQSTKKPFIVKLVLLTVKFIKILCLLSTYTSKPIKINLLRSIVQLTKTNYRK